MLRGCCGAAGCAAHTAGLMLKAVSGSANVLTVTFMKRGKGFKLSERRIRLDIRMVRP